MPRKKKQQIEEITLEPAIEEATTKDLRLNLESIKAKEGVIGYILRNKKSASIDLKDPTKLIDYAFLSSSALEAGEELAKIFSLGEIKDVVVEGKDVKILSLTVGENKLSIFMEKKVDHNKIYKTLT